MLALNCRQYGRALQPYFREDDDALQTVMALEGSQDPPVKFNQFKVNTDLFGIVSTYNENLYTIAVDKTICTITDAEAEDMARQWQRKGQTLGSGSAACHVMERGMKATHVSALFRPAYRMQR
jgi:PAB1-binding protein PBP1